MGERIYNFSAGPAMMPESVLHRAASEMLNYNGTGMSVMEMSHRSKVYDALFVSVQEKLMKVLNVPQGYKILFLQGGATLQFSMIPMNFLPRSGKADYALTGEFSTKSYKEAKQYGDIHIAGSTESEAFVRVPTQAELTLDAQASYFHYCMNNTVYGTLWPYIPQTGDVPLVCDMSSCILSEPVDVSRFGLIYAGAQKNMGPAGLCVVIIREELAGDTLPGTPNLMNYAKQIKGNSMMNTPPSYGVYLLGLILDWVEEMGGLAAMRTYNTKKADVLYDTLNTCDFYKAVAQKDCRSLMNVTFRTPSPEMDDLFVKEAAAQGLGTLKGHRAVGGIRASIYNAMPMEGVEALAAFMRAFAKNQ